MARKYERYNLPDKVRYAYAYARYSSAAQNDASIEQQYAAIKQFADQQGITVLRWYEDRAMTGTNDDRPGFRTMLADVAQQNTDKNGQHIDAVVVWKTDRFARSMYDYTKHSTELLDLGCYVYKVCEPNVSGSCAVVINAQLAATAEMYSIQGSENISRGMDAAAAQFKCVTQAPYGLRRGADGYYEIVEPEAAVVREIFNRYAAGDGIKEICADLNNRAIPTRQVRRHGQIVSDGWSINSIRSIIKNPRYKGTYVYHDKQTPGVIPAIVPPEIWDTAADVMQSHAKAPRHKVGGDVDDYILSGKVVCGDCGCDMVGDSGTGRHGTKHRYYSCRGHRAGKDCSNRSIQADALEQLVAERVQSAALSDASIDIIATDVVTAQSERKKKAL